MIGIIGAMEKETRGLVALTEVKERRTVSGIEFVSGTLSGREVVIATCGIGKVFAAMCAQTMILNYAPELIINTGVAGSLSDSLGIGDVVVSRGLVQHDMDTTGFGDPRGLINGLGVVEMAADSRAKDIMLSCCRELGINCTEGLIATGDQFICTGEAKDKIVSCFGALACEMEGGAVAQICCANGVPFLVNRAISDGANEDSGIDYPTFVKMAAENSVKAVCLFLEQF